MTCDLVFARGEPRDGVGCASGKGRPCRYCSEAKAIESLARCTRCRHLLGNPPALPRANAAEVCRFCRLKLCPCKGSGAYCRETKELRDSGAIAKPAETTVSEALAYLMQRLRIAPTTPPDAPAKQQLRPPQEQHRRPQEPQLRPLQEQHRQHQQQQEPHEQQHEQQQQQEPHRQQRRRPMQEQQQRQLRELQRRRAMQEQRRQQQRAQQQQQQQQGANADSNEVVFVEERPAVNAVYRDAQNVHSSGVTDGTHSNLRKIMRAVGSLPLRPAVVATNIDFVRDFVRSRAKPEPFVRDCLRTVDSICAVTGKHSKFGLTPAELLSVVVTAIRVVDLQGAGPQADTMDIVMFQLRESAGVCTDGLLKRLVGVFDGHERMMAVLGVRPAVPDQLVHERMSTLAADIAQAEAERKKAKRRRPEGEPAPDELFRAKMQRSFGHLLAGRPRLQSVLAEYAEFLADE